MVLLVRASIGNNLVNGSVKNIWNTHNCKISFVITQFLALAFCGTHIKPHVFLGLIKHHNLCLYPKLGRAKFAMRRIPRARVSCTKMVYKPWFIKVYHI